MEAQKEARLSVLAWRTFSQQAATQRTMRPHRAEIYTATDFCDAAKGIRQEASMELLYLKRRSLR